MKRGGLTFLCLVCVAPSLWAATNASAGRPYLLWPSPAGGSDAAGPDAFRDSRTWYRGQLTDRVVGAPDPRGARGQWVQFGQSCGPTCVVDLGRVRPVVGVAVHALGGGPGNLAFPTAVRVRASKSLSRGEGFAWLGWRGFDFPHTKNAGALSAKRLEVAIPATDARFVQVQVDGRRNATLWVTEVEVLAADAAGPAAAPPPLPRNVALGATYTVSQPARSRMPDRTGRELTDGAVGGAMEKHSPWASWANRVEIDISLPRPERVGGAEIGALGGNKWGYVFPERMEVYALDPKASARCWLRLGMAPGGTVPEPVRGRFATRRYRLNFAPVTASTFRIVVTGPRIVMDEIALEAADRDGPGAGLGSGAAVEAEDCLPRHAVADPDAVAGKAVRMDPGLALSFETGLAPGDYVLRVRAKATEQDVFAAVGVRVNGRPLEPLYVTLPLFTRHRRYFSLAEPGARLELRHEEGPAVAVDRVRIEPAFETARIQCLKPMGLTTTLTAGGRPSARIVSPRSGLFSEHARRLAGTVERLTGAALPVVRDAGVKRADYGQHAHIVLGTYLNNRQVWPLASNAWGRPPLPKPGEFCIRTYHNPTGLGRNAVALLASDAAGMGKALDAFEPLLETGPTLELPPLRIPPQATLAPERRRQLVVDSGKWVRSHLRQFLTRWKRYGPEGFRVLAYRFFECMDSRDAMRVDLYHDGFADAELHKLIRCWDLCEEDPCFNDLERLAIANVLHDLALWCQYPYHKYLWGVRGRMRPEDLLAFAREQPPNLRWNHQTFPAYSLLTASQYFGTHYELPEAPIWAELARICFEPMRGCSKPGEDCAGYQDITMVHCLRYFTAVGDPEYLSSGAQEQFLRLRLIGRDNSGSTVNNGDSSPYAAPLPKGWETSEETHRSFLSTYWRPDPDKIAFGSTLGVYVHPVDPLFAKALKAPEGRRVFDKICFRTRVDPERHYLLVDGISGSSHGHWDGNSILRFFDNGRCFLVEGDYLNGDLKDHNTLTFSLGGQSGSPPLFSHLDGVIDTPQVGMTRSVTPDYNRSTWTRNIVWRKDRYFVVLDALTPAAGGMVDAQVRWRTLGKVLVDGSALTCEQAGGQVFHLINADRARTIVKDDARDGNKNWKRYPHAEPVTRLISHRVIRELRQGQGLVLKNMFYVAGPRETYRLSLHPVDDASALVAGSDTARVGVGECRFGGLRLVAGAYFLDRDQVVACAVQRLQVGASDCLRPSPDELWLDLAAGRGEWRTRSGGTEPVSLPEPEWKGLRAAVHEHLSGLQRSTRPSTPQPVRPAASRGLKAVWSRTMPATITALHSADLDRDGDREIVVGCADGTLAVIGHTGQPRWQRDLGHQINHVASGPVQGKGSLALAVGGRGRQLVVVDHQGRDLWRKTFEPGHPGNGDVLVTAVGDFDGDGKGEVAAGLDSSRQLVFDDDGTQLWRFGARHSTTVLEAADADGNGCDDLAVGCTYGERLMVYFAKTGGPQQRGFGASISGCRGVAFADLDGAGRLHPIFAGADAGLRACKPSKTRYRLDFLWQARIGSDEITRVAVARPKASAHPTILVASLDGFVAGVDHGGQVKWIRYLGSSVRDLDVSPNGERSCAAAEQGVAWLSTAGRVLGYRNLGGAVSSVRFTSDHGAVAACGRRLVELAPTTE